MNKVLGCRVRQTVHGPELTGYPVENPHMHVRFPGDVLYLLKLQ